MVKLLDASGDERAVVRMEPLRAVLASSIHWVTRRASDRASIHACSEALCLLQLSSLVGRAVVGGLRDADVAA